MKSEQEDFYKEYWYYKKHEQHIIPIVYGDNITAFWKHISTKSGYPLHDENDLTEEWIFDWHKIKPNFKFEVNYEGVEEEIERLLYNSDLCQHEYVLFDIKYSDPVFKVRTPYFIENWSDFIEANGGMGSVVCSEDCSLLMEFTNDHSYLLYSNFQIR